VWAETVGKGRIAPLALAKRLGVRPVGSLGVIVRGWREGRLTRTEAEDLLVVLDESSTLFATRAIIELAREQLREGEH